MKPQVPEGHSVRYTHYRFVGQDGHGGAMDLTIPKPHQHVRSQGGMCVAKITDEATGLVVAMAYAVCHRKDNYNKRIGRDIALGRALMQMKGRHE